MAVSRFLMKKSCSIRLGRFFENLKLSLQQWVIIFRWILTVIKDAGEAKVTEVTAVQAYQHLCDICSWHLLTHDSPILLEEEMW